MKCDSICHVVHKHRGMCIPVVVTGQSSEPFNTCRVPDAKLPVSK